MKITKLTNPTTLPVTLASIKDHLRIETVETVYDNDLTELIRTASEWVEANCHITLITKSIACYFDKFDEVVKLPVYPVSAVSSVTYYDESGTSQTLIGYQVDLLDIPAKLYPAIGGQWPETEEGRINGIVVTVTAGYGAADTNVPNLARHLMKLLVGHWFKNREAVLTGVVSKEIEFAANELQKMVRVNEFEWFA
jgi:uncharacterized phiE125 gp8 family phage protein